MDVAKLTDGQVGDRRVENAGFRDNAPTTAAQAATIILDGVRNEKWRILVGDDAQRMDELVRADPAHAYDATKFLGA